MSNIPPPYKPPVTAAKPSIPAASALPPPYKGPLTQAQAQTPQEVIGVQNAPIMTGEGVMQRLRYFENLASQYEHYIEVLQAAVRRLGASPPTGYFAPLKGEGGSYSPKVG